MARILVAKGLTVQGNTHNVVIPGMANLGVPSFLNRMHRKLWEVEAPETYPQSRRSCCVIRTTSLNII